MRAPSPCSRIPRLALQSLAIVLPAAISPAQLNHSQIKGTNYAMNSAAIQCNARSFISPKPNIPYSGSYVSSQVEQDLDQIALAGLNSVRIWPSFYGWLTDRVNYMANLKDFCRLCSTRNIRVTYVVWNAIAPQEALYFNDLSLAPLATAGVGSPTDPPLDSAIQQRLAHLQTRYGTAPGAFGNPWQPMLHSEPGNDVLRASGDTSTWPLPFRLKVDAYLGAIGQFFSNDTDGIAAYGSYDLFNEGDTSGIPSAHLYQFLGHTYWQLFWAHWGPSMRLPEFTVGFANGANMLAAYNNLANQGVWQTYLSYHFYGTPTAFAVETAARQTDAALVGLPLVCSEFYDKRMASNLGSLGSFLGTLSSNSVGGQMWGFLDSNTIYDTTGTQVYARFDGVLLAQISDLTQPFTQSVTYTVAPGAAADFLAVGIW